MIKLICKNCNTAFFRCPSRLKYGRGIFCSSFCQYEFSRNRPKKGLKRCNCLNCKKEFFRYESWLKNRKGSGKFCCRKCRDVYRVSFNHPDFISGRSSWKRGSNWQSQKRKALKRDSHICQSCSKNGTDVHHIVPFRFFGVNNFQKANNLSNLITLCKSCHRKIEYKILHTKNYTGIRLIALPDG